MSQIDQVFQALLFGEGFWIGFLIIISICLLVSYKIRYTGVIFMVALLFLAIEYNENLSMASNKMWGMVMCFVGTIFLVLRFASDVKEGRG